MLKDKHRVSIQNTPSTSSGKIRISFKSIDFYRLWGITKKDNCGRTSQNILFRPQPLSTPAPNRGKHCRCVKRPPCSPSSQPLQKAFRPQPLTTPALNHRKCCRCGKWSPCSPSSQPLQKTFRPQPLTTPAPNRGNCCRCGKPLPRVPVSQTLQKAFSPTASYHIGTESRETLPLRQTVTMFTLVTAPPEGLSPTVSFHTGTESLEMLPLRQTVTTRPRLTAPPEGIFTRSLLPHRHRIAETAAVVVNRYHASPSHRPSRRHFHPQPLTISAPNRGKHCRCVKRSPCSPSSQPLQKDFRPQSLSTPAPNRWKCCHCGKPLPRVPVSQPLQKAFSPAASFHTGTELREMLPLRLNVIVHGKRSS